MNQIIKPKYSTCESVRCTAINDVADGRSRRSPTRCSTWSSWSSWSTTPRTAPTGPDPNAPVAAIYTCTQGEHRPARPSPAQQSRSSSARIISTPGRHVRSASSASSTAPHPAPLLPFKPARLSQDRAVRLHVNDTVLCLGRVRFEKT